MRDCSGMFIVSTVKVSDRNYKQYETALCLNKYEIKVFEIYETYDEAKEGHEKWIKKAQNMTLDDFENHIDLIDNYSVSMPDFLNLIKGLDRL